MADGTITLPITPSVDGSTPVVPANSVPAGTAPGGKLGKNEFLQLLMVQMKNQDPLDPQKPEASIAQLAQFSALEQMTNLNTSFDGYRRQEALFQSALLKGREVALQFDSGTQVQGTVESVAWTNDGMQLTVNGMAYSMSTISSLTIVETPTAGASAVAAEPTLAKAAAAATDS